MTVGIIGAGAMGAGIAQIAAFHGAKVMLLDQTAESAEKGFAAIKNNLVKWLDKGKITLAEYEATLQRITPCHESDRLMDASLCIEAVFEDLALKKSLLAEAEKYVSTECILATNTSSLSVTQLASALQIPSRFIGMHFFNPPALMPLVEIIPAVQTRPSITESAIATSLSWGKSPVLARDTPGFIVNKIARPYYSEALRIFEENIATIEEIDTSMVAHGFKMGPFTLMDFIGHDVNYRVTESVWKGFFHDSRYRPSLAQQRLLDAGFLGRKTGRGFYNYEMKAQEERPTISPEKQEMIFSRILCMLINEAADTVYSGICTEADVEKAVVMGVNYPKGLMAWGRDVGIDKVVAQLDALFDFYHEDRYRTSPLLRNLAKL